MGCHSGKSTVSEPAVAPVEHSLGSKASVNIPQDAGVANSEEVSAATTASSACASSRNSTNSSATTLAEEDAVEDYAMVHFNRSADGPPVKSCVAAHGTGSGTEAKEGLQSSHYEMLGLSSSCSSAEIRKAYLDLLKICHPDRADRNGHVQNATSAWFRNVNAAYVVLSDSAKRHAYDLAFGFVTADQVDACTEVADIETSTVHTDDQVMFLDDSCAVAKVESDVHESTDIINVDPQPTAQSSSWWQGMLVQMQIPACVPMVDTGTEVDLSHSLARRSKLSDTPCSCAVEGEIDGQASCTASSGSSANLQSSTTPTLKVKEWQFKLKLEIKSIERDLKQLQRDEARLTRKKSLQEQKNNGRGAQAAEVFAGSIAEAKLAYVKLEQICDLARAVNLDLTTCLYTMKTPGTLVTAEVLQKFEKIAEVRGTMQEVLDDVLQFLAKANCDFETTLAQSAASSTSSNVLPETGGLAMREHASRQVIPLGNEAAIACQ